MSTLAGRNIKDSYGDLLQISLAGSGVDATLRDVEDGGGTARLRASELLSGKVGWGSASRTRGARCTPWI